MGTRRAAWVLGTVTGVVLVAAGAGLALAGTGDADPVGALGMMVGFPIMLWCAYRMVPPQLWQDTDTTGSSHRLAIEVRKREEKARKRLLGDSVNAINVGFSFIPAPAHNASGARPHGILEDVADYYRALRPGRLVITGAPGAGKTVLALHLMILLLERRTEGEAVPVRLSLSSFDPSRHTLQEWLTIHLTRAYNLRPKAAAALVDARLVLPVLDGLDEMDSDETVVRDSRAATALEAMNAYLKGRHLGQVVVTCRTESYARLEGANVWAQDAARVDIAPVDALSASEFVKSRSSNPTRWQPVLNAIAADRAGPLAEGLSTPWRLTLAVAVYDERHRAGWIRDPAELLGSSLRTAWDVRDHLLDLLIPASTGSAGSASHAGAPTVLYSAQQVRAWLTVLAGYLNANTVAARSVNGRLLSGTELVLHELWPLAGRRTRVVHFLLVIGALCIVTLPLFPSTGSGFDIVLFTLFASVVGSLALAPGVGGLSFRLQLPNLRTWGGRFRMKIALVGGIVYGLMMGIVGWLLVGPREGILNGVSSAFAVVFVALFSDAPRGMFSTLREEESMAGISLRRIVRDEPIQAFVFGLLFGFLVAVRGAPVAGAILGVSMAFLFGAVGVRYVAFLLGTRRWWSEHWLPWRLGRFLDWCCEKGLMRQAGIAYQFRHRELQDFLARVPPGP